jgi:hypothetical protein
MTPTPRRSNTARWDGLNAVFRLCVFAAAVLGALLLRSFIIQLFT